jgi:N-acetylglucosamine-6-phosphate deacetylase
VSPLAIRGGSGPDGTPYDVTIADGLVTDAPDQADRSEVLDATGLTVAPGLMDLQVNGAGGIDITAEPARLWEVGATLATYGVTAWVPTLITCDPDARATALETLAAGPPDRWVGAQPLGLHFEGPMLSRARLGAHPEQWVVAPSAALVAPWSRAAGVLMVTIAPELPGALDAVAALVAHGVIVSVGHTDATAQQVYAAVDAGVRYLTHLGNAMPPMLPRAPGPVGVALADDTLVAGVIADGHHHHPAYLRTLWRALGPRRFLSVSDTTAALGLPDGPTRLGDQSVVVGGGTIRLPGGTLAGSVVSLVDCMRVLRATTGCSLADALATATTTAASLVGDPSRGRLTPGARGDVTLLDPDLTVVATVVGGRVVHRRT